MIWLRPPDLHGQRQPFCAVLSRGQSYATACNGQYQEGEESEAPAEGERCRRCCEVVRKKEWAAGELERFEGELVELEVEHR